MGLRTDLGFEVSPPNRFQRLVWMVASSRPGAWFFSKTGRPRTSPLLGIPFGDDALVTIGTNFAQRNTPAWAHNLAAHPAATVSYRDRDEAATP